MQQSNAAEQIYLIDSHCHLDMEAFESDLDDILHRALLAGVNTIITIGIDRNSSFRAVQLAERYSSIYASVQIRMMLSPHPEIEILTSLWIQVSKVNHDTSLVIRVIKCDRLITRR